MNFYVYDIETYPNIYVFVFKKVSKNDEYKIFEISNEKNQIKELKNFLKEPQIQIGFNNTNFDYYFIHFILNNSFDSDVNVTLNKLNNVLKEVLSNNKVKYYNYLIKQIDLFKIWHYDNMARNSSLKWLEFTNRWKKVQDLPFKPGVKIDKKDFQKLIDYCINDVDFTYYFFSKSIPNIKFREQMSKFLNYDVTNYSDVKIGEYINRLTYEKLSKKSYNEFKDLRTIRDNIEVKDLIPDFIEFKTKHLINFLNKIKKETINIKDDFYYKLNISGITFKFAKGGLHSEDKPKIVECQEGYYLQEDDVGSMYPSSIINGNLYPEHLGENWYKGIEYMFNVRINEIKPKLKKLDKNSEEYHFLDSKQAAFKLGMNGGNKTCHPNK